MPDPNRLKICFIGSRGIPRCYSGFETFVEEVAVRLVRLGHAVTVYNRIPFNTYKDAGFSGVRIVRIPTIPAKGTDTLAHSALCTAHALTQGYDIVYFCGVGSSIFSLPAKWGGARTVVNVDGADWERAKWGTIGKTWLRWSEKCAARLADKVIADHPLIQERYRHQFGIDCALISYGADVVEADPGTSALELFGLISGQYFLYVSRLTPENAADVVMRAHLASAVKTPLIVVGDAPYVSGYLQTLRELEAGSSGKIRLLGYQFGDAYRQLSFHAKAFVFPTTIEATRPVLLEQMGMGACIVARDTPANRHILADAAIWFPAENPVPSLAAAIQKLDTVDEKARFSSAARQRVREHYNWDVITRQYCDLFFEMTGRAS